MKKKFAFLLALSMLCGCSSVEGETDSHQSGGDSSAIELSIPDITTVETTTEATTTEAVTSLTTVETTVETTTETTAETTFESKKETEAASDETTSSEGKAPDSYRAIGENGILVMGRNGHYQGIMFYGGTFGCCDDYIATVKKYAEQLPNVNVYSMVIPTSVDFYCPDDYKSNTCSQKEKIDYIKSGLAGSSVTDVNVYDTLNKHKDEEIYTRTDHHWFPLGAYYAAEAFAKTASVSFPDLKKYKAVTCGGYVGSLYYYSEDENLYNDPEDYTIYLSPNCNKLTTTYYDSFFQNPWDGDLFVTRDASSYYCSFLGSDDRIAEIKTDVKNGKTLVVIKESYGNALIPFLTSSYENIYVIDLRYFELNAIDFIKNVGASDLLFANCAYTPAGGNGSYLEDIRIQKG